MPLLIIAIFIVVVFLAVRWGQKKQKEGEKTMETQTEGISPKSRLAVALFAWFLGGLGVHRFYLGKIFTGLVILSLAIIGYGVAVVFGLSEATGAAMIGWLMVGAACLWAIIDFIMAVAGAMKDKDGVPIKRW
jgi:TM2 domain-containing membrane protein YozV